MVSRPSALFALIFVVGLIIANGTPLKDHHLFKRFGAWSGSTGGFGGSMSGFGRNMGGFGSNSNSYSHSSRGGYHHSSGSSGFSGGHYAGGWRRAVGDVGHRKGDFQILWSPIKNGDEYVVSSVNRLNKWPEQN